MLKNLQESNPSMLKYYRKFDMSSLISIKSPCVCDSLSLYQGFSTKQKLSNMHDFLVSFSKNKDNTLFGISCNKAYFICVSIITKEAQGES
jgi:hypothetical protein